MLSNAVLGCLIYFGTFGYNNENPSLINNRLVFDNYYDINMTIGSEVAHYHDRFVVDCDFALVPNENNPNINDVYVAFNSFTYEFYTINNTSDGEILNESYSGYTLGFDDFDIIHKIFSLPYFGKTNIKRDVNICNSENRKTRYDRC